MKVVTTVNTKTPKKCGYGNVDDVVMIFKSRGYTFALHASYNPLIKCYMLSEYKTGKVFTAFGVGAKITDADIDRSVQRAEKYLKSLTKPHIQSTINGYAPINGDDVPEQTDKPDYSGIVREAPPKVVRKVEEKPAVVKKKRGRKKPKETNTLI